MTNRDRKVQELESRLKKVENQLDEVIQLLNNQANFVKLNSICINVLNKKTGVTNAEIKAAIIETNASNPEGKLDQSEGTRPNTDDSRSEQSGLLPTESSRVNSGESSVGEVRSQSSESDQGNNASGNGPIGDGGNDTEASGDS